MLSSRSTQSWPLRLINGVARPLRSRVRLDADSLSRAARKQTGLTDFGDPHYRQGLDILIESAEGEAQLHFLGRTVMRTLITRFLCNRLLLTETRKRNPRLFDAPLVPPLIILGLPRSGTTFLHGLLAADPANRAIPAWQAMRPVAGEAKDRRRQTYAFENRVQNLLIPKLGRMHYSRVDTPEECVMLFGTTFVSAIFSVCAPVYGYADWLRSQDKLKAYQEYLSLLQLIQGPDPTRRFALKSPIHTPCINTLLSVMPEALVIQTHRHPVAVCNSTNSLVYAMHNLVTESHDIPRLAASNIDNLVHWAETSMAVRDSDSVSIHDVFYDELLADPVAVVQRIYARFGLEWTGDLAARLKAYVAANPQGRHGKHVYYGKDFGLHDEQTEERFQAYIKRFGLSVQKRSAIHC
jgi:hypothetical protein